MADKVKKESKTAKYKAVDSKKFKESFNDIVPFYVELSNGESVVFKKKDKHFQTWLNNKIITKE